MGELVMDRLRENLENLKMKNTLSILDNYLERAVSEKLNVVDVLDYIFDEEAKSKRKRAYEKQGYESHQCVSEESFHLMVLYYFNSISACYGK